MLQVHVERERRQRDGADENGQRPEPHLARETQHGDQGRDEQALRPQAAVAQGEVQAAQGGDGQLGDPHPEKGTE